MPGDLEASFPATANGLSAAMNAIERCAADRKLNPDLVSRLRITVEELFSNTIKYGYGVPCDRPIRLRLTQAPVLTLTYEDDAPPFDPTEWKPDDWNIPIVDRPAGKTGLQLIFGLSASAHYSAGPNGNRLTLTFAARSASS